MAKELKHYTDAELEEAAAATQTTDHEVWANIRNEQKLRKEGRNKTTARGEKIK